MLFASIDIGSNAAGLLLANVFDSLHEPSTVSHVTLKDLNDGCQKLKKLSVSERMEKLQLRPDRADVIVPAAKIFSRVMTAADINTVLAPKLGLVDGLISELAQKYRNSPLAAAWQKICPGYFTVFPYRNFVKHFI